MNAVAAHTPRFALVIPCYNEGHRLDTAAFDSLLALEPELSLVLVDDGSSDDTEARLCAFAQVHPERARVIRLASNRGKAEAVRTGLRQARQQGFPFVGYLDADMATPPAELVRLYRIARDEDKDAVLGSRVALLGRPIKRSFPRHVLGRLFATAASLILEISLYDTQCGAKVFRGTTALDRALVHPFVSRWAFDVELLGRLMFGTPDVPGLAPPRIVEEPLGRWSDIHGSKLGVVQMAPVLRELVQIRARLERYRRGE